MHISFNEFHVSRTIRDICGFNGSLFASTGNVIFANMTNVRIFADKLNSLFDIRGQTTKRISAGNLNAMGLIDEIFHYVCTIYRKDILSSIMVEALQCLYNHFGEDKIDALLTQFNTEFPPTVVYKGIQTQSQYLTEKGIDTGTGILRSNKEATLEEMILLILANENPAFKPFKILFDDVSLKQNPLYKMVWEELQLFFKSKPTFGPYGHSLIELLREPVIFSPNSLKGQLDYIRTHWGHLLGSWLKRLLAGIDTITEEEKAAWHPIGGDGPDLQPYNYDSLSKEYERFSPDQEWMPRVVLMAKTVLVWLDQLSKKYKQSITRLDQIPDEELDTLANEGFTGLWLIGLWQRSYASKRIKQLNGNPEAAASAYSLYDYNIADNLGGWSALENLRTRLWKRGIRLASDMVPNHTGMDSHWVMEKPDVFVQRRDNPFPQYTFNGENLSQDPRTRIYLEDHYYSKSDCAVVFKRVDNATGDVRYIYHGNDGTGMPWNDTAQIDFLNPVAREAVIQEILHVARNFPIIRFDAAMVLAKKHIRRLWYPEPGHGGDIATRSETGLSNQEFEQAIPNEFWREVVDRVAQEVPDTLLLAEAFWMMEGFFVRTLGMHRVYNSAFMNMLKKEENQKYRDTVKNTIIFDPQILKRYVNFMNNPDEETAVAQFGKDGKYFGVCTLMVTMPGLPMFGHGQIEGFEEKYGMEYTKAYKDETPDSELIRRHWQDIFPLMKKRYLFAEINNFLFFDVWNNGTVNENIFAYSNGFNNEFAVVFYNNKYEPACGWIKQSVPYAVKTGSGEHDKQIKTRSIAQGLMLSTDNDNYCIFQDHHSGLWFVRSCADIQNNGMFVSLKGFEYQVLLNFKQITDGPDHKYRILCEALGGKGTEDLEAEWNEIRFKELYTALRAFVTDDFLTRIYQVYHEGTSHTLTKTKATAELTKILKSVSKNALAFYKTADRFAGSKKDTAKTQLSQFTTIAKKILHILCDTKVTKQPQNYTATLLKACSTNDVESFTRTMLALDKDILVLLLSYAIVKNYADKGYATEWALARKFNQYLRDINLLIPNMYKRLKDLYVIASTPQKALSAKSKQAAALAIVTYLVYSPVSQDICGTNSFENTVWFNKEQTDFTFALLFLLRLLSATKTKATSLCEMYKTLMAAKTKAAYKSVAFVNSFKPTQKKKVTKKRVTKSVKKAATKKKSVKTSKMKVQK